MWDKTLAQKRIIATSLTFSFLLTTIKIAPPVTHTSNQRMNRKKEGGRERKGDARNFWSSRCGTVETARRKNKWTTGELSFRWANRKRGGCTKSFPWDGVNSLRHVRRKNNRTKWLRFYWKRAWQRYFQLTYRTIGRRQQLSHVIVSFWTIEHTLSSSLSCHCWLGNSSTNFCPFMNLRLVPSFFRICTNCSMNERRPVVRHGGPTTNRHDFINRLRRHDVFAWLLLSLLVNFTK